jgi:predicted LPLAT superfamily acyltransferase
VTQAWLAQRERGTLAALRTISWITRHLGYWAGRALLHPITLYFVVFSRHARRASRAYLSRILGRPARFGEVYRHYHTFASAILDRVLLATGRLDEFALDVQGVDVFERAFAQGRGLLLLGAHLGSFELCRAVGATRPGGLVVNIVMHEANAGKIVAWMRETAPDRLPQVIAPGRPETMLRIREALARSEVVAMLGDRPIGHSATVPVDFLGAPAHFPTGPLRIARSLKVPVVLFFGMYRGPRCYDLRFEPLPEGDLDTMLRDYAARLEVHARTAPFNWFNFYDFWERTS